MSSRSFFIYCFIYSKPGLINGSCALLFLLQSPVLQLAHRMDDDEYRHALAQR